VSGLRPIPSGPVAAGDRSRAPDLVGVDPHGAAVEVTMAGRARPVLVAFLHTRCDGCHQFWTGLRDTAPTGLGSTGAAPGDHGSGGEGDPPGAGSGGGVELLGGAVDPVIVTKGPGAVDAGEVADLAGGVTRAPVVMSDQAWADYRVTSYPFFVLVDPAEATVIGETVGFGWSDVASMVGSSLDRRG
jgi:hypothetical protein